ncbi:MAG: hypothetical protein ABW003_27780 [Microvirga sp.]
MRSATRKLAENIARTVSRSCRRRTADAVDYDTALRLSRLPPCGDTLDESMLSWRHKDKDWAELF